jgi:P-type Ca2+ transporter type 2C
LAAEKPIPAWRRFLAQFQDVLILLLLVATAISVALWAIERDAALPYDAIAIFAVVLLVTMGYVQESRAGSAGAALRAMSAADATVIRDGERRRIPAADIVAGEIMLIEEGDTIPADGRLVESMALLDQSADFSLDSRQLLPAVRELGTVLHPEPVQLANVFFAEILEQVAAHQLVTERYQDSLLELPPVHRQAA